MTNTTTTIVINTTKESAEAIRNEIDAQPGSQSHITERKNLDGDTAMWILIANLSVQALPHILAFLKDYLPGKRVTRVKVGEIEVDNPTPAILQQVLDSKLKPEETDD